MFPPRLRRRLHQVMRILTVNWSTRRRARCARQTDNSLTVLHVYLHSIWIVMIHLYTGNLGNVFRIFICHGKIFLTSRLMESAECFCGMHDGLICMVFWMSVTGPKFRLDKKSLDIKALDKNSFLRHNKIWSGHKP